MPAPKVREFYAETVDSGATHVNEVAAGQPFALFWTCENTARLRLVGPHGVVFDQQGASSNAKGHWQIVEGISDTATFLLSAISSEEQMTSQYLVLFVPAADKTFRNLKVGSTLTLEG
ncbi:hypothetical protein GCM10010245_90350 [Streptomyces spectabilis]|uniref:Uncharacterized protein n=1 Tax=Streptomyces spectabilis TaxID=68270 RepID=A0A7W8B430_STRST|nr:hypothetical protein [Streptomyces spectabilis]MBB5109984.1 hypothetical protein [Streptomyces spectabilis]GGV57249.1 hypothetical protein GCM10010245_90350 [Streptomyces spectabilis]